MDEQLPKEFWGGVGGFFVGVFGVAAVGVATGGLGVPALVGAYLSLGGGVAGAVGGGALCSMIKGDKKEK